MEMRLKETLGHTSKKAEVIHLDGVSVPIEKLIKERDWDWDEYEKVIKMKDLNIKNDHEVEVIKVRWKRSRRNHISF